MSHEPLCVVLIGPPASGKTTFMEKHYTDFRLISIDTYVTKYMKRRKLTYVEAFSEHIISACQLMITDLLSSARSRENMIIDLTNITRENRDKKLHYLPSCYRKVAIHFHVSPKEQKKRIKARGPGWEIPERVLKNTSWKKIEPASGLEGFTRCCLAENFEKILPENQKFWR